MTVTPKEMANAVRFLALDAIVHAGDGHPGTPLGAADICTALFTRHLKFDPPARAGRTATASCSRTGTARR